MHKQASHPAGHKLVIGNTYCNLLFYLALNSFKKRVSKHPPGRVELLSSRGSFLGFPRTDYGTASSCPHSPALRLTVLDRFAACLRNISHLSSSLFIQTANVYPFSQASATFSGFFPLVSLKPQTSFFLARSRFLKFLSRLRPLLALLTSHHYQPPKAD